MHLYGVTIYTQDKTTRRIPLLAAWDLSPFSWLQRQQMQDRMTADAKDLAEETGVDDQAQFESAEYIALSSGRPEEDELCGVILTDPAYPRDASLAVLDKMLEEIAVRVPKARYQGRIAQLIAASPWEFLKSYDAEPPLPPEEPADWTGCMPRLGDDQDLFDPVQAEFERRQAEGHRVGIDDPILVAALEFPSAQEYLSRYQDVQLAKSLAFNQMVSRTTGGQANGVASRKLTDKKRTFFGLGSHKTTAPPPPLVDRPVRAVKHQASLASTRSGFRHAASQGLGGRATSAQPLSSTSEEMAADTSDVTVAEPRTTRPSTFPAAGSNVLAAPTGTRERSATIVASGPPLPPGTDLTRAYVPERDPSSIQASLSALKNITRASSTPDVDGSEAGGETDDARTPTPLAGVGAVRAALACSPVPSHRTQRMHAYANAMPKEELAPIQLERKLPVFSAPEETETKFLPIGRKQSLLPIGRERPGTPASMDRRSGRLPKKAVNASARLTVPRRKRALTEGEENCIVM